MPNVMVPEAPRKSFKLKQLHELNKTAKYLQIPSQHLLFLALSAYIRKLANMVTELPWRSCLLHENILPTCPETLHVNRHFHPASEHAVSEG